MKIHTWLKEALRRSGKSQANLARFLRCDPSWVSLALSGKRRIYYEMALEMEQFLGLPLPHRSAAVSGLVPVLGVIAEGVWREIA